MVTGWPLHIDAPVSPSLLGNISRVQALLASWFPEFRPTFVRAPLGDTARRGSATTQLFTGGVDSYATLRDHEEVEFLLYTHDLVHDTEQVQARVGSLLAEISKAEKRVVLEAHSNLRILLDQFGEWGTQTHGATLTALGAFTSGVTSSLLCPASHREEEDYPWGSHPRLDPLWSSDQMTVNHDGAYRGRFDKIAAIAKDPSVLKHLRVCWQAINQLNCSQCEKCLRTMTSLELLGVLDNAPTFSGPLDLEAVAAVELLSESDVSFSLENLAAAQRLGAVDIAKAIATHLSRSAIALKTSEPAPKSRRWLGSLRNSRP